MIVAVTGGRNYTGDVGAVLSRYPITLLILGDARGADALAREYAKENNIPHRVYYAEWGKYGRNAGPMRNARMLMDGSPDLVIAFPGGIRTNNMVKQSRLRFIPVVYCRQI